MNASYLWPILASSMVLGGCTSTYSGMVSENDVPELLELRQKAATYPRVLTRIPTFIGEDPQSIALVETGRLSEERVVVLVHGCSSDPETWRYVVGALGKDHDLILVALLGCGLSDSPDPASVGSGGYSPDAMAERILQALDAYLLDRPDVRITLVGHSVGGTIALRMTACPTLRARHAAVLERVDRMVLLAPMDVEFPNPPAAIVELATVTEMEIWLGDITGILQEKVALAILGSVFNPNRALREDVDRLCDALRDRRSRLPLQAILTQARPMDGDDLDWPAVERMVADYANVDVPCLILWGEYDDTLPVSMGFKLEEQIPTARLHIVEDCMHSPQLEHPVLVAEAIRRFTNESNKPLVLVVPEGSHQ